MTLRSNRSQIANSPYVKEKRSSSAHYHFQLSPSTNYNDNGEHQSETVFDELHLQDSPHALHKYQRPILGLQQYDVKEPASKILRQSGIYRGPGLTTGQRLYLLDKCHIYDNEETKRRRTNAYLQILARQFEGDARYKPEFRFNDPREFFSYTKFIKTPRPTARPVNTGYFTPRNAHSSRPRTDHNKQQQQHSYARSNNYLDKNDFTYTSNSTKQNSTNSSRTNTGNVTTAHIRQEPKSAQRISVKSS
ncbi:unnamed protein product [Adineta steineri]|uniref:Uncharacterized protein n=1 Tax=Adineta steineri TaxID=433720 RepID=A0A813T8W3_9BILA|nr:unnamed protein product [Adineta steineri]